MWPIIKWSLWQKRWSIFFWSLGLAALIAATISFYPSFSDQAQNFNQTFQNLPDTAKSFISDTNDFASPSGFLSSQLYYLTLPLLLSVLAIGLGSRLLAKEEEEGTLELVMSRPIHRVNLLAAKGLAGLLILGIVTAIATATAVGLCRAVGMNIALGNVAEATLLAALIAALFGALSFWITTLGRTARLASIGVPAIIAVGGYAANSLATVVDWLKWPARCLPYHYYRPGEVLTGNYQWLGALGLGAVILLLFILSWHSFRRRDIGV